MAASFLRAAHQISFLFCFVLMDIRSDGRTHMKIFSVTKKKKEENIKKKTRAAIVLFKVLTSTEEANEKRM